MDDKTIEKMKKIIEAKKKESSDQMKELKPDRVIGGQAKGRGFKKKGGVFDK